MKILALDTSTNACSVTIDDGNNTFNWLSVVGNQHAKVLLPQIEQLLATAKLQVPDLDLLAFGMGPGSFTGLRIGASIIQGISVAYGIKVAPVSSLQALARQASKQYPDYHILSLLDARMSEVYLGLYSPTNTLIANEVVVNPATIDLANYQKLMVVGTGIEPYKELLAQKLPHARFANDILYPRAQEICELAPNIPSVSGELALPQYIRNDVTDRSQK
jgi:tRNA threonylcarbamoyladenosine biosynthesis protein TsaB